MSLRRDEQAVGRAEARNSALGEEQATISFAHAHCSRLKAAMSSEMRM